MARSTSVAVVLIALSGLRRMLKRRAETEEQSQRQPRNAAGEPLNSDHLAPTGKTLPDPGVPQASGTMDFDCEI